MTGGSTSETGTTGSETTGAETTGDETTGDETTGGVEPVGIDLEALVDDGAGLFLDGSSSLSRAGFSVNAAGDVNGDGIDDLIVLAAGPENGEADGRVYVVFGDAALAAGELPDIASGTGGFAVTGLETASEKGRLVDGAGDVNGDGLDDLIIGSPDASPNGDESGEAFVVFGKADGASVSAADLRSGLGGFVLNGEGFMHRAGYAVSGAGDINGDALADVLVSSLVHGGGAGWTYVVFGKADTSAIELADVAAGAGGFQVVGDDFGDIAGASIDGAGDVNGDNVDDIVIGAPGLDASGINNGRAYVVFGKSDTTTVDLADVELGVGGFEINAEPGMFGDSAGGSVSGHVDVNGDGLQDLIVGAPLSDQGGDNSGRAYVVFGKADTAPVDLVDVVGGVGGFAINGAETLDWAGRRVAGAGDFNNDGMDDILIATLSEDLVYLVFGTADTETVELGELSETGQGLIFSIAPGVVSGSLEVGPIGDINDDGIEDFAVGAPGADPNGNSSGRVYVVFGTM